MKIAVLVPDGAADLPLDQLDGKTPLEAASIPTMDRIAVLGTTGTARMVPVGMPAGSDVANLSLFGYDPSEELRRPRPDRSREPRPFRSLRVDRFQVQPRLDRRRKDA